MNNNWLQDVESRGKVGFNTGTLKSYKEAEQFARKNYRTAIERDCFVAGWNTAFWDEQARVLKTTKARA